MCDVESMPVKSKYFSIIMAEIFFLINIYMDNTEKYYKSFGLDRSLPRSFLKKQELNQLFAIPKKEPTKLSAHIYNFEEDNTHQADILFYLMIQLERKSMPTL
jgi:hypothetical protein